MAVSRVFLPSLTWFSSRIGDCFDGILAYGHNRKVIILEMRDTFPSLIKIIDAHTKCVLCVKFSPVRFDTYSLLATGGGEGDVKLFYVNKNSVEIYCTQRFEGLTSFAWRHHSPVSLFVAYDRHVIKEWYVQQDVFTAHKFGMQGYITHLASSPKNPDILAVGMKSGAIYLLHVLMDCQLKVFSSGSAQQVIDIFWSSDLDRLFCCNNNNELHVWTSVKEEDTSHDVYSLATSLRASHPKHGLWCHAVEHPGDGKFVVASDYKGNIGLLNLEEKKPEIQLMKSKLCDRRKNIFCIMKNDENTVLAFSKDGLLTVWDLVKKTDVNIIPTLNGKILSLAFSPFSSGNLAVAFNESTLLTWNVVYPPPTYDMKFIFAGSPADRVTCVSWHPKWEGLVAFGNESGTVGFVNTSNIKKYKTFPKVHNVVISCLSWGRCIQLSDAPVPDPSAEHDITDLFLFSCGGGKIYVCDPCEPGNKPTDLDWLLKRSNDSYNAVKHSAIHWKSDFSQFAIGNEDGSVDVCDGQTCHLLVHFHLHKQFLSCIRWHPTLNVLSSLPSSLCHCLAVGFGDGALHVYSVEEMTASVDDAASAVSPSVKHLHGHSSKITDIDWSIIQEDLLASSSCDGTVRIWNVVSGKQIVSFAGHASTVSAVAWSLYDVDIVFSGGSDSCVIGWSISAQSKSLPAPHGERMMKKRRRRCRDRAVFPRSVEGSRQRSKYENPRDSNVEEVVKTHVNGSISSQNLRAKKLAERKKRKFESESQCVRYKQYEAVEVTQEETKEQSDNHATTSVANVRKKELFCLLEFMKKSANDKELLKAVLAINEYVLKKESNPTEALLLPMSDDQSSCLQNRSSFLQSFFKTKKETFQLLNEMKSDWKVVENLWQENVDEEERVYISVLTNDVTEYVMNAMKNSTVEDIHLAISPIASVSVFDEVLATFSNQPTSSRYCDPEVFALLVAKRHGIDAAIRFLMAKKKFVLAYAIAKSCLSSEAPVVKYLKPRVRTVLLSARKHEEVASFLILENEPLNAAKYITRIKTPLSAQLAAGICLKYEHLEEAKEYSALCLKRGLMEKDFAVIKDMITEQPSMEELLWIVTTHESITDIIEKLISDESSYGFMKGIFSHEKEENGHNYVLWKTYCISGRSYLSSLFDLFMSGNLIDLTSEKFHNLYRWWRAQFKPRNVVDSYEEALFQITMYICHFIYILLTEDSKAKFHIAFTQLSYALEMSFNSNQFTLLKTTWILFFPFDLVCSIDRTAFQVRACEYEKLKNNIIDEAYQWMEHNIIANDVLRQDFSVRDELEKGTVTQLSHTKFWSEKVEHALESATVVDIIFMIFAVCLLDELNKTGINSLFTCRRDAHCIHESNAYASKEEGNDISEKNRSEIRVPTVSSPSEGSEKAEQSIGESEQKVRSPTEGNFSHEVPKSNGVSEEIENEEVHELTCLSHVNVSEGTVKIGISKSEDKRGNSKISSEGNFNHEVLKSNGVSEDVENEELNDLTCVSHVNVPEGTVKEVVFPKVKKEVFDANHCTKCSNFFFNIMNGITALICKDAFKITPLLTNLSSEFANASKKQMYIPKLCSKLLDSEFDSVETVEYGDETEAKEITATEGEMQEDQKPGGELLQLLKLMKSKGQVERFPDPFSAIKCFKKVFAIIKLDSAYVHLQSNAKLFEDFIAAWSKEF